MLVCDPSTAEEVGTLGSVTAHTCGASSMTESFVIQQTRLFSHVSVLERIQGEFLFMSVDSFPESRTELCGGLLMDGDLLQGRSSQRETHTHTRASCLFSFSMLSVLL